MEWIYIVVALLAIVVATFLRQQEAMTNADVNSAIQTYGTETPKPKGTNAVEHPIYGPKAEKVDKSSVQEKEDKTKNSTSDYPGIYGPDVGMVPGAKNGGDESYFKINTDLAKVFPTEGAPQPYLTDFSKIQG